MSTPHYFTDRSACIRESLTKPSRRDSGLTLAGCVIMFLILQGGLTGLATRIGATWVALVIKVAMLFVAVLFP